MVICVFACAPCLQGQSTEPTINQSEAKTINKAVKALETSRQQAIEILLSSLSENSSAAINFALANIYFEDSQYAKARHQYEQALKKQPSFDRARANLVHTLLALNELEQATNHVRDMLTTPTPAPSVYTLAGYAYLAANQTVSAESAYRQALLLDSADINAKTGLARCLMLQERYNEAEHIIKQALEQVPDNKNLWSVYANCAIARQKPQRAIAILETSKRLNAVNPQALLTLGDLYLNANQPQKAVENYQLAFKQSKPTTSRLLKCAQGFLMSGNTLQAEMFLDKISPTNADEQISAKLLRAQLYEHQNKLPLAAKEFKDVLKTDPLNKTALKQIARIYTQTKQYAKAELFYDRALAIAPLSCEILIGKAQLEMEQNHPQAATKLLKKAQSINPQQSAQQYLNEIEKQSVFSGAQQT